MDGTKDCFEPPFVAFPQADDIWRVAEIVDKAAKNRITEDEIATFYKFAPRQAKYYLDAARYLGLVQMTSTGYVATPDGRSFSILTSDEKRRALQRILSQRSIFAENISKVSDQDDAGQLDALMASISRFHDLSHATLKRRAQCALTWMKVIF